MKNLLKKEGRLAALPLTYCFFAFGFMALLPGYPILLAAFFVCLGLFQTFQTAREANDLLYTALLPIRKADAVKGRYLFCALIELGAFAISAACTLVRMTALKDAAVYRQNALMTANFVYLGFLLLVYGCFNAVFVRLFQVGRRAAQAVSCLRRPRVPDRRRRRSAALHSRPVGGQRLRL